MKKLIALAALLASTAAFAQNVGIGRVDLGSGVPGQGGHERAQQVLENDIYHAPQYMPGFPTAATIWPRVVEVPCTKLGDTLKCQGYGWQPKYGRGEYLFFKVVLKEPVPTVLVEKLVPVPQPYPVYVEVQKKKE